MRIIAGFLLTTALFGADFKAGVARQDITPTEPIWLSGYASRTKPSEGVMHKLWAKALALEDGRKSRVVIVTTDLIGLPRSISDIVAARVLKQYGLDRSRLLLNSSHTHSGPVVRPNLATMYNLSEKDQRAVDAYASKLTDALVDVVGAAISELSAATSETGHGKVTFAMNRREPTPKGVRIGVNPSGPMDHDVPVLVVKKEGKPKAVLFGYACHNTTLGGDLYRINGDYAGFAQLELESAMPGTTAMFLMLAGADQNPNPRGQVALAEQHGKTLAMEVQRLVQAGMKPLTPQIRAAWLTLDLPLASHTREQFEKELTDSNPYRKSRAQAMLRAYDEKRPVRTVPYPVQAIRLSRDMSILAMGGELVVDYQLWGKAAFPGQDVIVSGYSNDVMCYIPTAKIIREGGYEPVDSMIYYGMPGPFDESVEEVLKGGMRKVMAKVGVKADKK